ncbi:MAG: OmpA family protein [Chitinophagaceae bacterium]
MFDNITGIKNSFILFLFLITATQCKGQHSSFKVSGTITGKTIGDIFLFFEGDVRHKDSLSAKIVNGQFELTGKVRLPILARFHMGQNSWISDVYLQTPKTTIIFSNRLIISEDQKDTMNVLKSVKIVGSNIEQKKSAFEATLDSLENLDLADSIFLQRKIVLLNNFVKTHRNSILSPYFLDRFKSIGLEDLKRLLKEISPTVHESYEYKTLLAGIKQLEKENRATARSILKDFIFLDSLGIQRALHLNNSDYTLIIFWASWCVPCRVKNPELNRLDRQYDSSRLRLIGVTLDTDKTKWKRAIKEDSLQWTQLENDFRQEISITDYYGIDAIPRIFLIDNKKRIVGVDLTIPEVEEILKKSRPEGNPNYAVAQERDTTISIYFPLNSSEADSLQVLNLNRFLGIVKKITSITGYADTLGSSRYNMNLSLLRARFVRSLIFVNSGLQTEMDVLAKGELSTENPVYLNRKVDVTAVLQITDQKTVVKKTDSTNTKKIVQTFIQNDIHFVPDKAIITPESFSVVEDLANLLESYPGNSFEIVGHVNYQSNRDSSQLKDLFELSRKRAEVIYEILIKRGISRDRLQFKGVGNSRPLFKNPKSEDEKLRNMRVEINVLSAD